MTLQDELDDIYRRLGLPTSPASATITRMTAFLNETQAEIMSEPGFDVLLHDQVTFASVASTPEYSLPQTISTIKAIRDATNRRTLQRLSASAYRAQYPSQTAQTGLATHWVDLGYWAVDTQPSNASELFFKSSSASDGATKSVTVEGYITGGYFRSATVAMNGVTAVSLGATITTWIEVTKFQIVLGAGGETTAAGTITLHEDSGSGTELARIPIGGAKAKYRHIALAITPSSAVTYTVDFERELTDMVDATDEPLLPTRFHRMLATGARMKEYEKTDNTRYLLAKAEFDKAMKNLKLWVHQQADGSPNLRGPAYERSSRLGAWYPSTG